MPTNQEKHVRLSTQDDDSLDEDENTPWLNQSLHQDQKRKRLPTILTFLAAMLMAASALGAVVLISKREHRAADRFPMLWDYFLKTDRAWTQPTVVERVYQDDDPDFQNKNLTIATQHWSALYPDGEGIVGLTDREVAEFGLHDSIRGWHDESKRLYLVGAYHQLHCLGVLRSNTIKHYEDPTFKIAPTFHHTMHCVDVLRQALMCAADSSLIHKTEGMWPGNDLITKCRNFDALTEWTLKHEYVPVKNEWVP